MFTKEEYTLKWILGFSNVIFVMHWSFFSPYYCREHVLEMKVEIILKMIRYRTSIQKIYSPIGIFETIPLPSCESGGHCQTSGSRDT